MPFTPLSEETEFTFPPGNFDVRGWEVRAMTDGEKVGEVEDLLIDETGTIRYLDVDLITFHKHVLLPVARSRVDEAETVVWVPGMSRAQFEAVPSYDHNPDSLTDDYQSSLATAYADTWPVDEQARRAAQQRAHQYEAVSSAVTGERVVREGEAETAGPVRSGPLLSLAEVGVYEVSPDSTDPRGWEVIAADERRVGTVHDLLIEPSAMKVRYLDCEVTMPEFSEPAGGRHILIPVGYARLDNREKLVYIDALTAAAFSDLPSFPGLPLEPVAERRVFEIFARGARGEAGHREGQYGEGQDGEGRAGAGRYREGRYHD
jgi:sporulation protein YlmC with PRC-barrel domain